MSDSPSPRKQLRLFTKGKGKVDSLFRRRRNGNKQDDKDSDFEDDQPILSRINEPSEPPQSTSLRKLNLKANAKQGSNDIQSPGLSKKLADGNQEDAGHNEGTNMEIEDQPQRTNQNEEQATKARKRQGMIGVEGIVPTFNTNNVISGGRLIAKQPGPDMQAQPFTFGTQSRSLDTVTAASQLNFSPQTSSFNASIESHAPLAVPLEAEQPKPGAQGVTVKQFLVSEEQPTQEILTSATQNTNPRTNSLPPGLKPRRSKGADPLAHLKLDAQPAADPPRLDQPSDIHRVLDYISPQIPLPEPGDQVYRYNHYKKQIPQYVFNNTLPDAWEATAFAQDVIGDTEIRLTKDGDVPALESAPRERVPLGARETPVDVDPSGQSDDPIKTKASSLQGLPYHARVAAKRKVLRNKIVKELDDPSTPDHLHTAPFYMVPTTTLKRKRPTNPLELPPPDYIFQSTKSPDFNIFTNGFLLYPELCLLLAAQMQVKTLINLYSISKDFHVILNQRSLTVILNQATLKAPAAARCYPWRCFDDLSQPDPAFHAGTKSLAHHMNAKSSSGGGVVINIPTPPPPPSPRPVSPKTGLSIPYPKRPSLSPATRRVPTFRWLQMAIHREKVIHALYQAFAMRGIPLPGDPNSLHQGDFALSLHKLWFLMDIPDNTRRIIYTRTTSLMADVDLGNMLTFVVKLDMACNDPVAGEKRDGMRKLMLSAIDGFDTILKVVRREMWTDELDVLRAWTRFGFQLDREQGPRRAGWAPLRLSDEEHTASKTVFGIKKEEVGLLKREFWGKLEVDPVSGRRRGAVNGVGTVKEMGRMPQYLMRPDQILLREVVRREMTFQQGFLRALITGYVDEETLEAVPPRDLNGGRSGVLELEGEYDVDDAVAGLQALDIEEGGDPLLDLGDTWQGSPWTVEHMDIGFETAQARIEQDEALQTWMAAWRSEVDEEKRRRQYTGFRVVD
ncbi:hypothetical protein LTR64_005075 [Lithohypha guttulata]|uniref:uncharacterized protein n=1 Tax=Lithohypha guttulata TaxID=1690604 RepID=UPI002DE19EBC|nr:hypothetical protein LTR51_005090 [Lithohypha guttulata]